MTQAGRATFDTARGGVGKGETDLSRMSKQYSNRDLPGHTKLKYRHSEVQKVDELFSDLKKDLEKREKVVYDRHEKDKRERGVMPSRESSSASKRSRGAETTSANQDADDVVDEDEDSDEDDDDDEEELMRELEKIRREKAAEAAVKEGERKLEEERIRTENILRGNPLVNQDKGAEFRVKRRWDDDVVFKNCAKEPERRGQFINDTLRTEFHKKFMDKYIK